MKYLKKMPAVRLTIIFWAILLFISCSKEGDSKLTGTWTERVNALPTGYYINELTFNADSTFSSKGSSYGIYGWQGQNDLSGWYEFVGNYSQSSNSLGLISHKVTSWDKFYDGQPFTEIKDQLLFENCKYKITKQVLEINYTTYPADGPVNTTRIYTKAK